MALACIQVPGEDRPQGILPDLRAAGVTDARTGTSSRSATQAAAPWEALAVGLGFDWYSPVLVYLGGYFRIATKWIPVSGLKMGNV